MLLQLSKCLAAEQIENCGFAPLCILFLKYSFLTNPVMICLSDWLICSSDTNILTDRTYSCNCVAYEAQELLMIRQIAKMQFS